MARTERPDSTVGEHEFRIYARQLEQRPPCRVGCPNSGDIRGWLGIIAQRDKQGLSLEEAYDRAWSTLAELNPFPATLGRICPHPCESRCARDSKDGPVAINAMERFLGDWAVDRELSLPRLEDPRCRESIGVIGSGPAGLSFAYQMARRGYPVTVYEKRSRPGGMLRHAIPDYRLPKHIVDAEIDRVFKLGVELRSRTDLNSDVSLEELRERHSLLFLGMGAQGARALGIPGESLDGVVSGIDYLDGRKRGLAAPPGRNVVVVGGGNTAIDAARTARRDGASVTVLYRRSRAEMPAAPGEVEDAIAEGVRITFLAAPVAVHGDNKTVTGLTYQCMRLGEPDDQGRRQPLPVDGETGSLAANTVIVAVSQAPDWQGIGARRQWLKTEADGRLSDDLWAGGDDTGPGIASRAVAQGRLAAQAAHAELRGEAQPESAGRTADVAAARVRTDYYADRHRCVTTRLSGEQRLAQPDAEVERTISAEQASEEAARCMSCGLCFDCGQCIMYCNAEGFSAVEFAMPGSYYTMTLEACEGCGKCIELCPCGYLAARD